MFTSQGTKVLLRGEDHAIAATPDRAAEAAMLLNKARDLNDRQRKYTAAARLIAKVETLPGFAWLHPV